MKYHGKIQDKKDLVTKEFVENSSISKYETMPTPSADYLGQIVQYVGTSSSYNNGYFYKCTYDTVGSSYSWTNINVQSGGGGGSGITISESAGGIITIHVD